jgi:hypothetical protein
MRAELLLCTLVGTPRAEAFPRAPSQRPHAELARFEITEPADTHATEHRQLSGPRAFENEVRGALLIRDSFPDPATREYPFAVHGAASEDDSAGVVVEYLLRETDLLQLADRDSLRVSVGAGNWISWSIRLHPATMDPATTISKLWNASGELSFRRCWPRAGKYAWFRSTGAPSLHFEVVPATSRDRNRALVQGHVDAANPWSHPRKHLVEDYLPSLGIGRHPGPREMLQSLLRP